MFKLGLTGSIGMGKSTTAKMFAALGCEIWDADAAVHRLYDQGGAAVAPLGEKYPQAIKEGRISRPGLRDLITKDPSVLKTIEQIVHPLLAKDRADFIQNAKSDILVFDIPLLFETGGDAQMDAVVTVWCTPEAQETRVMARQSMTMQQFEAIRAKQLPAHEKRDRADYVIITDTIEHAQKQVQDVVTAMEKRDT